MEVKFCSMKETQASGFEWLGTSLIREELLSGGFVSELISNVLQPYLVNQMINHSVDFSPLVSWLSLAPLFGFFIFLISILIGGSHHLG